MIHLTQRKAFVYILFFLINVLFISGIVFAQEEVCEDGFIRGKLPKCPCVDDPGMASICGFVSSANIQGRKSSEGVGDLYDVGAPLSGVTITIYENKPFHPTGQPFGNLERKFVACETTEEEGKYWCPMRRITPGNMVYVVFSCNGKVADIKIVPSVRSITNLNSQVDCNGDFEYTSLPSPLTYTNRDDFLGCVANTPYDPESEEIKDLTPSPNVGFEQKEIVNLLANTEEEGADIKFSAFPGLVLGFIPISGTFAGSWDENDCIFLKSFNENTQGLDFNIRREYSVLTDTGILGGLPWNTVIEKCNLDPNRDNNGAMEDIHEMTVPFRHDIPNTVMENEQVRVWETRTSLQREIQDPKAFAQYNHLMFSECVGNVFLRGYGSTEEDTPISCDALIKCSEAYSSNPLRNTLIMSSFAANLQNPTYQMDIIKTQERDPNDIVCQDENGEPVTVAEIQPPLPMLGSTCKIGEPDCVDPNTGVPYKLPSKYYLPQFMIAAGGVRKPKTSEPVNDAYSGEYRDQTWEQADTEAERPHKGGHDIVYEDASKEKTNSGVSAVRISGTEISEVGGTMVNSFVSYIDAVEGKYNYTPDTYILDVGGNPRALCSISSVSDNRFPTTFAQETATSVNNVFRGDTNDHVQSEVAETATYATDWGRERDQLLSTGKAFEWMHSRDLFDSLLRYASGGAQLDTPQLTWALLGDIFNNIRSKLSGRDMKYKSFLERKSDAPSDPDELTWQEDTGSRMFVEYCIAEDNFKSFFPPYGGPEPGYPGDGGGCYPWVDIGYEVSCNVYPGTPAQWSALVGSGIWSSLRDAGWPDSWPGIVGNLRTCKETQCSVWWKVRHCINRETDPIIAPGFEYCTDTNGDGIFDNHDTYVTVERRDCTTAEDYADPNNEVYECLRDQLDTWRDYSDGNGLKDPDPIDPIDWKETTGPEKHACDLWRAGPMQLPGNLFKDHMARTTQEAFDKSDQFNTDPLCQSSTYTALAFRNPTDPQPEACKGSFEDYATTNDMDSNSTDGTIGSNGAAHALSAGALTKGLGTGASLLLREPVAHPMVPFALVEEFPSPHWEDGCLTWTDAPNGDYIGDSDEYGKYLCQTVPPPGELDIDNLSIDGSCRVKAGCTYGKEGEELMQEIAAAAGSHIGNNGYGRVPAAVILAAMAGEGAFGGLWDWTDENVMRWSDPWYARISGCNEMVQSHIPPFGMDSFQGGDVDKAIAARAYHPSRVNSENVPIVSKCNFLDGAYMLAYLIASGRGVGGGWPQSCSWGKESAAQAISVYEYGKPGMLLNTEVYRVLESCLPDL